MKHPLEPYINLIDKDGLHEIRLRFISEGADYQKESDTVLGVDIDSNTGETIEYRESFAKHLSNKLYDYKQHTISQLEENLNGFISKQQEDDYLSSIESKLDQLIGSLHKRPKSETLQTVIHHLEVLKGLVDDRFRTKLSQNPIEKLKWKENPIVFFVLFQELYSKGFLGTSSKKDSMAKFSRLLYELIDVPPINKEAAYTSKSFEQNLKPSGGLQDHENHQDLRDRIGAFLKIIIDY